MATFAGMLILLLGTAVVRWAMKPNVAIATTPPNATQSQDQPQQPTPPTKAKPSDKPSKSRNSQTQKNSGGENNQQQQNNSGGTNSQQQSSGNGSPNVNAPNGGVAIGRDNLGQITVNNRGNQVGWLHPENWPLIPPPCGNSRGVFISLGNTILPADKWPKTVLVLAGEPVITLDRNEKGEIAITEDVFNQNDDIVVAIEKNNYKISDEAFDVETDPPNSTNPTRLQVIVKHNKEKVLDIEYQQNSSCDLWTLLPTWNGIISNKEQRVNYERNRP